MPSKDSSLGWIKMQDSTSCFLQELHIKCEDKGQLKVKEEWKKICPANANDKMGRLAILISNTVHYCRWRKTFYMINESILWQDRTILTYRQVGTEHENKWSKTWQN